MELLCAFLVLQGSVDVSFDVLSAPISSQEALCLSFRRRRAHVNLGNHRRQCIYRVIVSQPLLERVQN